jgi:hypothetical protein
VVVGESKSFQKESSVFNRVLIAIATAFVGIVAVLVGVAKRGGGSDGADSMDAQ